MPYNARQIAEMLRENMRLIQKFNGEEIVSAWEDRSPDDQEASTERAQHMIDHGVNAREAHEKWYILRYSEGWRYGPVKDYAKKESPLMVHYDDLPFEQRVKDMLYEALVEVMTDRRHDGTTHS